MTRDPDHTLNIILSTRISVIASNVAEMHKLKHDEISMNAGYQWADNANPVGTDDVHQDTSFHLRTKAVFLRTFHIKNEVEIVDVLVHTASTSTSKVLIFAHFVFSYSTHHDTLTNRMETRHGQSGPCVKTAKYATLQHFTPQQQRCIDFLYSCSWLQRRWMVRADYMLKCKQRITADFLHGPCIR